MPTLEELERDVLKAKENFRATNDEAFKVCKAYGHLEAKTNELRDEWLGLCGVLKAADVKSCGHLTGLILLKQRIRDEYRDLRLACLRTLKKSCELLAEANSLYREYMALKKRLKKAKEAILCC